MGGELYVIKNWLASDVWEFLLSCGSAAQYPLPSYLESNSETAEMYRSATGECIWTTQDKKQSDSCGARFGCWACQSVGLDKSMQALLNSDPARYGYMEYLNRIQRFLGEKTLCVGGSASCRQNHLRERVHQNSAGRVFSALP